MSGTARRVVLVVGVVALIGIAGLFAASQWTPTIPAGAASSAIAEATVVAGGAGGQQCLDRLLRGTGWMDLCWAIYRSPDGDPEKDYYTLQVYGTLSGAGSGIRWSRVRANLLGEPRDGVFDVWPAGTIEGPCRSVEVVLPANPTRMWPEEVCGRTIGALGPGAWTHTVDWTCVGCLIPDRSARPVGLYVSVGVAQGVTPRWSIGADFGD